MAARTHRPEAPEPLLQPHRDRGRRRFHGYRRIYRFFAIITIKWYLSRKCTPDE